MHLSILILFNLVLFNAFILYPIEAKTNSLSFDLIHRDSKLSPFYNHSMTELELSSKAFTRSLNRLNNFDSSVSTDAKYVASDLTKGDYFMNIAISAPEMPEPPRLVIPDMVSDLIWVRCGPCTSLCRTHASLYDPTLSETYYAIPFSAKECNYLEDTTEGKQFECRYQYDDPIRSVGYSSSGVLSTENFYFKLRDNKGRKFSDIVFGCDDLHKENSGKSVEGVVGLGQGKLSLVSQLGKRVGKKFSYCLRKKSVNFASKIAFGSDIILYNQNIEYKAKITHDAPRPYYYLHLEGISVNNQKIKVSNSLGTDQSMIVDIQTALTSLPTPLYDDFIDKFKAEAGGISSTEHGYRTCFLRRKLKSIPKIVFHFKKPPLQGFLGAADFHVNHETLLHLQDNGEDECLTIVRKEGISFLGSRAQVNMQMIFDLSGIGNSLTFSPLNCIEFSR